jgi:hypothetical protein
MPRWALLSGSGWLAARRPLALSLFIGCAVSLMATGTLTLRLALPAAVYWSFVPLVQIAGLAIVMRGRLRAPTIDAWFAGHGPWMLWLAAFAAMWTLLPAHAAYGSWQFPDIWWGFAAAAAAWSLWIDFGFFRRTGARSPGQAAKDLAIQRLVSWSIGMTIFVAPAGWQTIAARFGL